MYNRGANAVLNPLVSEESQSILEAVTLTRSEISQSWRWWQPTDLKTIPSCSADPTQSGPEHVQLTAALAHCCLYQTHPHLHRWLGIVRLAALYHTDAARLKQYGLTEEELTIAIWLIDRINGKISTSAPTNLAPEEAFGLEQALRLGHAATDTTLKPPKNQTDLEKPLYREMEQAKVGLAMGGATKVKEYVFESSKLPEVRGASALLDYINLKMIPALFNQLNRKDYAKTYDRVETYTVSKVLELTPECLIYSNGGEFLAFTPASQATLLAQLTEEFYAVETMTAQAVSVGEVFSLLEIRFGINYKTWENPTKQQKTPAPFSQVVSYLSQQRYRRREFNPPLKGGDDIRQLARFETFPLGRRCDSCDRRMAVVEHPPRPDEPEPRRLCEPCARKLVVGQQQRDPDAGNWFDAAAFDWKPPLSSELEDWATRFDNYLKEKAEKDSQQIKHNYLAVLSKTKSSKIRLASDLNEIGDAVMGSTSREGAFLGDATSGFVGVIYGDGNNMGGLLKDIRTPAQYHLFAESVFKSLLGAVQEGLATHLRPAWDKEGQKWYHPFEILSVGGDDIYLYVPGVAALPLAVTIAELVEKKLKEVPGITYDKPYKFEEAQRYLFKSPEENEARESAKKQSQVSLSSGVLIAPLDTPVFFLDELVHQLLKSAKARASKLREAPYDYQGGTIDFMALKSVTLVSDNIKNWREHTFRHATKNGKVLNLNARPYTLWEMQGLLSNLKEIKQTKLEGLRGKLYQLREQLSQGELAGRVNYRYLLAQSGEDKGSRLGKIFERWLGSDKTTAPWRKDGFFEQYPQKEKQEALFTIIADLTELYDFVSGKERE